MSTLYTAGSTDNIYRHGRSAYGTEIVTGNQKSDDDGALSCLSGRKCSKLYRSQWSPTTRAASPS